MSLVIWRSKGHSVSLLLFFLRSLFPLPALKVIYFLKQLDANYVLSFLKRLEIHLYVCVQIVVEMVPTSKKPCTKILTVFSWGGVNPGNFHFILSFELIIIKNVSSSINNMSYSLFSILIIVYIFSIHKSNELLLWLRKWTKMPTIKNIWIRKKVVEKITPWLPLHGLNSSVKI